jgi:hypothetical protein
VAGRLTQSTIRGPLTCERVDLYYVQMELGATSSLWNPQRQGKRR